MKNKLLLTSALISGLSVIGSAAIAETKITGDMKLGYKSGDAIGAAGNMAAGGAPCGTGSATVGLYGAAPDVTITFE